MSEQNPPSGQPSPPSGEPEEPTQPVEGVGPTSSEGDAPPSGPPGPTEPAAGPEATADEAGTPPPPPEDTTTTDAPPPPAKSSNRKPWIIGVAALLVLVLIGAAAAVIISVTGDKTHSIAIPKTAGGMKRDTGKETELKAQLDAAKKQFQTQSTNVSYVKSGVYNQTDKGRGPVGDLVFLGLKLKKGKVQSPTKYVSGKFEKAASTNGFKVTSFSLDGGDARGACAAQASGAQKIAICSWATKDSIGELIPTTSGWDSASLEKVMRDVRKDVETTD